MVFPLYLCRVCNKSSEKDRQRSGVWLSMVYNGSKITQKGIQIHNMTHIPHSDSEQQKAQVQDYFSRTAEGYVASFSHRAGDDLKRLVELGEWQKGQRALDIATGGGHTALAVAPHVAQVTVTDLTPRMLEKAREFLLSQGVTNAVFQVADAEALPFEDESFDRVTCRIAPHHFPNVEQFVREVARVLKRGGIFLLIDCMAPSEAELDVFDNTVEKWRDPSHGRSCTVEEWQAFFREAGLRIEHIRSYFEVQEDQDGRLVSFTNDFIFLKGRKS